MGSDWKAIVADKKRRQLESIPREWIIPAPSEEVVDVTRYPEECGLLNSKDIEITNTDVDGLLKKLAAGKWSSVEVTRAFYKRAIIAHQLTNCLTEIFVDRALERAAVVDEHLTRTGKVLGPLHGLPVSLKDQLSMVGLETVMGYVSWVGKYAKSNAILVDILNDAGAVPFVRTNVPQTLMWPETYNLVFGRTTNPFNRVLTCGGSSGGEGSLIALKGSPLGVGSDIGGSVRIPSAFCGLYGLRPSYGRVPYTGATNSLEGQESVLSVLGPLSASISGIKAFMQAVIAQKPWLKDPLATRKKWDEDEYNLIDHGGGRQLCFGFLWDDGVVIPHPPIIRGLEITKRALVAAGHKVIDWKPLKHSQITGTLGGIWDAGSAKDFSTVTAVTGEPIIHSMLPYESSPAPEAVVATHSDNGVTAYELWQIQKEKRDLRKEYLDYWESSVEITGTGRPVDAIISPVAPYAAPPHGMNRNTGYTSVWNALDYPAAVFPVSTVDPDVDIKKPAHSFLSKADRSVYELYDPTTFKGAPIGFQLVGRTLEEEAVIAMTEIVDAAVKKHQWSTSTLPNLKTSL